jgi:hypothetical protein
MFYKLESEMPLVDINSSLSAREVDNIITRSGIKPRFPEKTESASPILIDS